VLGHLFQVLYPLHLPITATTLSTFADYTAFGVLDKDCTTKFATMHLLAMLCLAGIVTEAASQSANMAFRPIDNHANFDSDKQKAFAGSLMPKENGEILYFKNKTVIGRKSEGYIPPSQRNGASALAIREEDEPDVSVAEVLSIIGFSVATTAALCIISNVFGCGPAVGRNIGLFWAAVGSTGGEAAISATAAAVRKRQDVTEEAWGCQNNVNEDDSCTDADTTGPIYQEIATSDGSTVTQSCWMSTQPSGAFMGIYYHCIEGSDNDCTLSCDGDDGLPAETGADNFLPESEFDN
jgi:hypothetical protein